MNIRIHAVAVSLALLAAASAPRPAMAQAPAAYQSSPFGLLPPVIPAQSAAPSQNPMYGSVPTGTVSAETLSLSLSDSLDRGLRQNLGVLTGNDSVLSSQGRLVQARSVLLPNLSVNATSSVDQLSLAEEGFEKISKLFPVAGFPSFIGPFGYFDARVGVTQSVLDFTSLRNEQAARGNLAADQLSLQDTREIVVLVITGAYLQAIATQARVETVQAQADTAKALLTQATDQKNAGVAAGIDVLRSQVELQTQQQQLIAAQNDFSKQKLVLARIIGLPLGQQFTLSDTAPYESPAPVNLDDELQRAYASRADFQSAQVHIRAAESTLRATTAEHLPSLSVHADYGVAGLNPAQSHGTFSTYGALHIPIFAGNLAHGDALVAQASLDRDRQHLDDLRAQIEQEIRAATLDLQSASDQVTVARSTADLAQQTLAQARDRFRAGATDNIEVVEAQEAVARTSESVISSLYAYNLARVQLARATGSAEQSVRQYWKGK